MCDGFIDAPVPAVTGVVAASVLAGRMPNFPAAAGARERAVTMNNG
ncbi:hypothetical protein [Streptomyces sp. NPDC014685]